MTDFHHANSTAALPPNKTNTHLLDHGMGELRKLIADRPEPDRKAVEEAYEFARQAHDGVLRKSGEPYITHPVAVAVILAELGMDTESIMAGLLHDTVEDVEDVTFERIETLFGAAVRRIVEGETKVSKLSKRGTQQAEVADEERDLQAENLRQMLIAMTDDMRIIVVKLADRLHNMRTLGSMKPQKQTMIARETMEIFAPLAHRSGIGRVKWELEDLSFRYLDPEGYQSLAERLRVGQGEQQQFLEGSTQRLRQTLEADTELGQWVINIEIEGRCKHLWSIHQKMQKEGKTLEQIFDLLAIRVILTPVSIPDESSERLASREKRICYHTLSIVHSLWTPLPGRFKDYIAIPKSNGYRSLHTTVMTSIGQPIEIQIRSQQMHEVAQYGIASHWMYKQSDQLPEKDRRHWVAQLRELQEIKDPTDYMDAVKSDIFSQRVRVFTPKGLAVSLPRGSTSIDFAYHIHTRVGETSIGSRVNGALVPLSHALNNGDCVEIITSKTGQPSRDWLQFAVTRSARIKIRHYFRTKEREEALKHGHDLLERALRKRRLAVRQLMRTKALEEAAQELVGSRNPDELYLALNAGKITPMRVVRLLVPSEKTTLPKATEPKPQPVTPAGIYLEEEWSAPTKLSLCCKPMRGDPIMGYLTRGRGVSVHRLECPNLHRLLSHEPERCLGASWEPVSLPESASASWQVLLEIEAAQRSRLLSEVLEVLEAQQLTSRHLQADVDEQGTTRVLLRTVVTQAAQLQDLITALSERDVNVLVRELLN